MLHLYRPGGLHITVSQERRRTTRRRQVTLVLCWGALLTGPGHKCPQQHFGLWAAQIKTTLLIVPILWRKCQIELLPISQVIYFGHGCSHRGEAVVRVEKPRENNFKFSHSVKEKKKLFRTLLLPLSLSITLCFPTLLSLSLFSSMRLEKRLKNAITLALMCNTFQISPLLAERIETNCSLPPSPAHFLSLERWGYTIKRSCSGRWGAERCHTPISFHSFFPSLISSPAIIISLLWSKTASQTQMAICYF